MKKLFYFLFALAAMLLTNTSCSDDLENSVTSDNEATVSFKVQLESAVNSRAVGDGTTATNLFFAVYKAEDATKLGDEIEALAQTAVPVKNLTATINTRLVKGQSYNFVFWAQKENQEDGTYYNITNMGNIMVKYNADNRQANNEDRDAFYAVRKNLKVTGPINETITLKRPFAQVNVGAKLGSLAEASKAEVNINKSEITIENVATELDPYSGRVKSPTKVTYSVAELPKQNLKDVTINGETKDYEYLSMNYILVNEDNKVGDVQDGSHQSIVDATFTIYDDDKAINTFEIPNVPVRRNWRTNIIGDILSETVTFNVVIDPKFDGDLNYNTNEELDYVLANGGEYTFPANGTTTLETPYVVENGASVILNLNGNQIKTTNGSDAFIVNDGTLTIKGEGSVTTEDKTAGYAIIVNGSNAVANIYGGTYTIGLDDVTFLPKLLRTVWRYSQPEVK